MRRRIPKKLSLLLRQLLRYQPQRVYVFGSYARGEHDSLSDIDLVIVKETDKSFFERTKEVLGCIEHNGSIDILVYTPSEFEHMKEVHNAFLEMLLDEGICIYDAEKAA
jgi:DNA polymerase sigma